MTPKHTKSDLQRVRQWTDRLDVLLFNVLEVLQSGDKWSITPEGKLITVYPYPVVSMREMRITGIKYSQSKNYSLPDLLQKRLDKLNTDIMSVKKFKRNNPNRMVRVKKHQDVIARWSELLYEGVTKEEIADVYGVAETAISGHVNRYRKQNIVNEAGE